MNDAQERMETRTRGKIPIRTADRISTKNGIDSRIRKVTSGMITTVAGNGTAGYNGDNIAATSAQLYYPSRVAVDASGNLYIADTYNHRIRKVTSVTITTVAGNGTAGYNGDNIAATSAQLQYPYGVAVDSSGNLYIADTNNHRIRKVTSGTITTVAGNGTAGYNGDNIAATSAQLYYPFGVTVDASGSLYIGDTYNNRIRKVTSGTITTVAGGGVGDGGLATTAFVNPTAANASQVVFDSQGNFFIADAGDHRIRKVSASGIITTVAGNGTAGYNQDNIQATSAWLNYPSGVVLDSSGNIYIADQYNHRIRKVDPSGNITTVAGTGTAGYNQDNIKATSAWLYYPRGLAFDSSGNLYIADTYNQRIRKVDPSGNITTVAGTGTAGYNQDNIKAINAWLNYPRGLAFDSSGNLYIADTWNFRVRKVDTSGNITTVAGNGGCCFSGDGGLATSAILMTCFFDM